MGRSNGGRVSVYVDCVSPYSWFGFTNTVRFRDLLNAHDVSVEIIPFFLGAARDSAGNSFKPPIKAKEAFEAHDTEVTGKLLGLKVVRPELIPISSLFPVRVATWIRDHYPSEKFEATFSALAAGYWSKGIDISKPEGVSEVLSVIFPAEELNDIIHKAVTPENKKRVVELTKGVKAFGAPWIVAVNRNGEIREYFGNDRWDHVFDHLGVPYTPVRIIDSGRAKSTL